jgi:hypothetical protein
MANKTIPTALPPGIEQLNAVKGVTPAVEDYSYQVMDAQTANNRVGPGQTKVNKVQCCAGLVGGFRAARTGDLVARQVSSPEVNVWFWCEQEADSQQRIRNVSR